MKGLYTDNFILADAKKGTRTLSSKGKVLTVGDLIYRTYVPEAAAPRHVVENPGGDPERENGQSEKMDIATERLRKLGKPARTQEQEFAEINRLIMKVERQCIVDSVIGKVLKGE
jgi:hypothetical protein